MTFDELQDQWRTNPAYVSIRGTILDLRKAKRMLASAVPGTTNHARQQRNVEALTQKYNSLAAQLPAEVLHMLAERYLEI